MDPLLSYRKVSNHIIYNETAAQTHNKYITIQTQTWHNRYITIQTQTSEFRLQSADFYKITPQSTEMMWNFMSKPK